jgi:hypothetical protein
LSGKPFALLGVNSDADRDKIRKVIADEDINWRSWWDAGSKDGPIHTAWQITERPGIHILDANGVIRFKNIEPEDTDKAIDGLLAELAAKGK